ncbi:uncharacterized protein [Salminus brasiliensis]|uniref:uncharacterized protein n=1 Tax=Salminus brasiliensis TaxID=930266 RepID=UPI003B82FB71
MKIKVISTREEDFSVWVFKADVPQASLLSELKPIMILLPFFCVLLGALGAQAKVVKTFEECKEFFYNNTEPRGMSLNYKKICQKHGNDPASRFASLYSEYHRIPVYSAYIFKPGCNNTQGRHSKFFIEPQLSGYDEEKMSPEHEFDVDEIKKNQAINSYYSYTGYDHGHLAPRSFQCGDSRDATFTLTNAAPMDACFNRAHWRQWEDKLKSILIEELQFSTAATPYLVTGTVPQPNHKIPQKEEKDEGEQKEVEKVTVPSHVWTALCFVHPTDDSKSFSLGYIGPNQPDSLIRVMSVQDMESELGLLYESKLFSIFADDCFSSNQKSQEKISYLTKQVQLPSTQRLQMATDLLNTYETAINYNADQPGSSRKRFKVTEMTITQSFDNIKNYFQEVEKMKYVMESTCLLTKIGREHSGVQRRSVSGESEAVECQLVPEKSRIAGKSENYCTSPCLYQQDKDSYWCYYGQTQVQCSPLYSSITYNGKKCKPNHLCGTYGYEYYWCYTEPDSWDYCSPPIWQSKAKNGHYCRTNHACDKYGKSSNWCYTSDSNTQQNCCTQDDCFSAIDGKTCKPEYPCGFYGKSYMWCYTTDDSWDYCCKNC